MLLQIHHQYNDGKSDFVAQRDINSHEELKKFVDETKGNHDLPDGATWIIHTEKSKHFLWTIKEDG